MSKPSVSVAGIVITGLVATATLLLGGLGYAGYDSFRARARAEFGQAYAILADQLATSLALPLWNFDRAQIGKIIESAMQQANLSRVEVRPAGEPARIDQRSRDPDGRVTTADLGASLAEVRVEHRPITWDGDTLGEVRVFVSERSLRRRLREAAITVIGVIGLVDAILIVGVYLLLRQTVLQPLRELEQHALAVSSERDLAPPLPAGRYFGELANLRASIATMINLLQARYAEASRSEARHRLLAENLRDSEAKFSRVFHASPTSIMISDFPSGRIIDLNDAFLRTFETTREQAIGRTIVELGIWRDPAERDRLARLVRRTGHLRDFKVRERTVSGRPITALINSVLLEVGNQRSILTMIQDITDEERAAAALRESEEKFSKAFRAGPDAMAIAELETGRFLEVNEGFERLFGYPRVDVIGRTSLDLGIWRDAAARENFVLTLRSRGAVRDLEHTSVNRGGDTLVYLVSAECMEIGGRTCIVSAIHDISDRKRAEEEHARLVDRERKAREAFTRRLLTVQESERRRIAGELHDSLGQNLLLIKNRAQLALANGGVPDGLRWQFESITDMAGEAIAEVRQISHDLRPYQLDQLGLTRALEGMIESAVRNTGFPFERKLDAVDDAFSPEAATHLYRIVQESMNNILKHARARSACILLERDVHEIRLWIEDDGCGFTPAPAGPANTEGGFGLKNIAERVRILGGTLRIDAKPGGGTRIEVLVPTPEASSPAG